MGVAGTSITKGSARECLRFSTAKQPQASAFWPLIDGRAKVVVQEARKREIDDRVFRYVGVAGIDKPRIVQVGVSAKNLPNCN